MQSTFLRHRGARALAFAVLAAVGFAGATPARADWHHHDHYDHHDHWHGGGWIGPGYAAPPVVYGPAYAAPPVVYSPGLNVGIHIR